MTRTSRVILSSIFATSLVGGEASADLPRKAPRLTAPAVADRCAKVEPAPGTPAIPGGDLFGFTSPTDIEDPCTWTFASEHSGRVGRRDGSYFALSNKTQLTYTYSDRVAFALSAFTHFNDWSNVTAARDALAAEGVTANGFNRFQFDGFSGEILLRLLARSPGQPFAVTVAAEPRWWHVDAFTGWRAGGHGVEFKFLVDVALTDRLFAAMNLNYALGTQKYDIPGAAWVDGSLTIMSGALTYQLHAAEKQFIEGVFVGVEGKFKSAFEGLGLEHNVGNAFFLGPTFAVAFEGGRMLNMVWIPQVAGRARLPGAPGSLDLDIHDRHEFRIKYATPLPLP